MERLSPSLPRTPARKARVRLASHPLAKKRQRNALKLRRPRLRNVPRLLPKSPIRGCLKVLSSRARQFAKRCGTRWPRKCAPTTVSLSWVRRRSEEHKSELQSLMRISYAVICLKKKNRKKRHKIYQTDNE